MENWGNLFLLLKTRSITAQFFSARTRHSVCRPRHVNTRSSRPTVSQPLHGLFVFHPLDQTQTIPKWMWGDWIPDILFEERKSTVMEWWKEGKKKREKQSCLSCQKFYNQCRHYGKWTRVRRDKARWLYSLNVLRAFIFFSTVILFFILANFFFFPQ